MRVLWRKKGLLVIKVQLVRKNLHSD
jgi:hypothetical protein